MSIARVRREAAKRLGLELQKRYERLVTAGADPDAVTVAAVDLGQCFNDNIEFILWVLKSYGGLTVPPPDPIRPKAKPGVPQTPKIFLNGAQDN